MSVAFAAGDSRALDLARAEQGSNLFIRSLAGLSRAAVKEAFVAALSNLSANQIEFTNLIIDHLTEKSLEESSLLCASPCTDLAPAGPNGVFEPQQLAELFDILAEVKHRTVA